MMIWTEEADALLIRLWDDGASMRHVMEGMAAAGYDVTRNAIAGRKHRLPPERFTRLGKVPPKNFTVRRQIKPIARTRTTMNEPPPKPRDPLLNHRGVEYLDLPSWGCKAIMPERSVHGWRLHLVCGLRRMGEAPYCKGHYLLYTNPQLHKRAR